MGGPIGGESRIREVMTAGGRASDGSRAGPAAAACLVLPVATVHGTVVVIVVPATPMGHRARASTAAGLFSVFRWLLLCCCVSRKTETRLRVVELGNFLY